MTSQTDTFSASKNSLHPTSHLDTMNNRTKLTYCGFLLLVTYIGLLSLGFAAFYSTRSGQSPLNPMAKRASDDQFSTGDEGGDTPMNYFLYHQDDGVRIEGLNSLPSWYKFSGLQLHISSAFLDSRYGDPQIRIFAIQHLSVNVTLGCSFQGVYDPEEGRSPAVAIPIHPEWPPDKFYIAVMYTCKAPSGRRVITVDVTVDDFGGDYSTDIGSTVSLPLTHSTGFKGKDEVAVCVKAAGGQLKVDATIEFLEFYRLLGIQDIVIYNSSVSSDVNRVLEVYAEMGVVKVVQFPLQEILYTMAKNHHHMSKADHYTIIQQTYLLSINDCMYRFMDRYRYMIVVDLDEILTPFNDETLPFLLQKVAKKYPPSAAYTFRTSWYFEDFNKEFDSTALDQELTLMNRLYRTPIKYSQPKSVVLPNNALTLNWHGVVSRHPYLGNISTNYKLPNDGDFGVYLHHFRPNCIEKFYQSRCDSMRKTLSKDDILPRYQNRLKKRVQSMKQTMGLS